MGLGAGISFFSRLIATRSSSAWLDMAAGKDRLRVTISKSLNLTFNVTVLPFAVSPDLVDERLEFGDQGVEVDEVGGKRVFGADGFADPVGADLPVVDATRDPIVIASGLPEIGLHEVERLIAHVEAGVETQGIHLGVGRWPDAVELADGRASTNAGPISGVMTYWPFGLR